MSRIRPVIAALAVVAVALPVGAAIQAMNLKEFMAINDAAVHGTIVARDTIVLDHPAPESIYTRLTVQGTDLLTGEPAETQVVFLGSHDPADRFNHSEMPELRDVRLGNEVIAFSSREATLGGRSAAHNLAYIYRVERGFGEPVVIGKGDGFAFPENARLTEAKKRIDETHKLILAERAAAQLQGQGK